MKIHEFKTENPIKEEIRPEYVFKYIFIYRQKNKKEFIDKNQKKQENYNNKLRNEQQN